MPIVRVEMYPRRTHEQKAALAKAITEAMVNIAETPAASVHVIIQDIPKDHWAQGGVLASDVQA